MRNYFLYAIGEIALVMIGILLALQVNNWNEIKKDRTLERDVLRQIKDDLNQDLVDHNENIGFIEGIIRSSKIVMDHRKSGAPYHDSLNYHFGWLAMGANFDEVRSGYDMMVSIGLDIVLNDTLRNKISYL